MLEESMTVSRSIVVINHSREYLTAIRAVLTIEEYLVTTYLMEEVLHQPLLPPPPDLLIIDYHPGLDQQSSAVYQALRQQAMTATIPLIVATTSPMAFETRFPAYDKHTHLLTKPFLTAALLHLIGQLLEPLDDNSAIVPS
jgi:CheY-like chemotaxis protein